MGNLTVVIWCLWSWVQRLSVGYFIIQTIRALPLHFASLMMLVLSYHTLPIANVAMVEGGEAKEGEIPATQNLTEVVTISSLLKSIISSNHSTLIENVSSQKWLASLGPISVLKRGRYKWKKNLLLFLFFYCVALFASNTFPTNGDITFWVSSIIVYL